MRRSTSQYPGSRPCDSFWSIGLLLFNLSVVCTGFLVNSPLSHPCLNAFPSQGQTRAASDRRCNLPPLNSKGLRKWNLLPGRIFRKRPKRTSSYLISLDKQRGYHRKPLGPLAQIVNNTDVNLSPDKVAGALVGKLSSEAFKEDCRRRSKVYASDWTDAFKDMKKVIPAVLFLYFACLSPAVSFGTIASQITDGSIGIVEFLISCGGSGMLYAVLCGQPMSFIAPTGLTLAFISGLFRFCSLNNLPFFPVYAWVGLWTAFFFVSMGLAGSSQLIRYCTRFTDEVFNALLSINFIYEAVKSLKRNFQLADPMNLTMPFVSLMTAMTTFWATMSVTAFQSSKYLTQKVRTIVKDFGPVTVFVAMSLLNQHPWMRKFHVPTLSVPNTIELAKGRQLFIPLNALPFNVKMLCSLPAILLTALFFMDQNISVRVVNNPDNKLKKGSAYNLDMVALGLITGLLSLVGLPWMCGATVQSLNHVRAMTETQYNKETEEVEIVGVTETRFTGFVVHALIASTVGLLPLLKFVPIPVVAGVFLFLGRKLMSGNSFLQRIRDGFTETDRLEPDHPIKMIGRTRTNIFTTIQVLCLAGLWAFKECNATAIFFPSVIGMLMVIRSVIMPKFFTTRELAALGEMGDGELHGEDEELLLQL
ncbi:Electroneutral sodium bicarbonate exchanger 1 [Seminavis robusta]|uniref:Electroneutral sodium bicarbonate exchanger 1 n=1 Tax=Seminavis robusta TaxID=568900 RepID=A0A9N8DQ87_9STRA|nr:Electroneutral sodium bicarbonate exchanger 1 [Seminavis robusta]|eukprot:Sro294_g110170.1 Electroneutral sodium bicarbonate exchanger 1 (646) ;mRNA; r:20046-22229